MCAQRSPRAMRVICAGLIPYCSDKRLLILRAPLAQAARMVRTSSAVSRAEAERSPPRRRLVGSHHGLVLGVRAPTQIVGTVVPWIAIQMHHVGRIARRPTKGERHEPMHHTAARLGASRLPQNNGTISQPTGETRHELRLSPGNFPAALRARGTNVAYGTDFVVREPFDSSP